MAHGSLSQCGDHWLRHVSHMDRCHPHMVPLAVARRVSVADPLPQSELESGSPLWHPSRGSSPMAGFGSGLTANRPRRTAGLTSAPRCRVTRHRSRRLYHLEMARERTGPWLQPSHNWHGPARPGAVALAPTPPDPPRPSPVRAGSKVTMVELGPGHRWLAVMRAESSSSAATSPPKRSPLDKARLTTPSMSSGDGISPMSSAAASRAPTHPRGGDTCWSSLRSASRLCGALAHQIPRGMRC
jgi:hypothetical protein